jgi:chitinase
MALLVITGVLADERAGRSAAPPVVLGYYPSWRTAVAPNQIDYRVFTHLTHAFVRLDAAGAPVPSERIPNRELARRAHQAKVKVLLAVGGADSNRALTQAARDAAAAEQLAGQLVDLVARAGYDGIDVDWEFPASEEDADRMVDLVRRLRAGLNRRLPGALLTMAVPAGEWAGKWYDRDRLLPEVDWVSVMTYDFHGPWSSGAGHNAPLAAGGSDAQDGGGSNCAGALAYWTGTKRWPRERLLVGIPAYGRGFAVQRWGEKPVGRAGHPEIAFREVAGLVAAGWTRRWDDAAKVPYLEKPGGGELISYEDEESAALKGAWAAREGVRGIFFWEITQDFVGDTHRLVRAARDRLLEGSEAAGK